MSSTATIEELKSLTDDALFTLLKQNVLSVGPVTSTTRGLYEKRLIKHFKENRNAEISFNQSMADQTNSMLNSNEQQLPEPVTTKSPSIRPTKHFSNQQETNDNGDDDNDIIITHEVNSPSSRISKTSKTDNLLDFKLLPDTRNDQGERRDTNMFSSHGISSTPFEDRSTYTGLGNISPGRSILINRNRQQQQQQQFDSRPRINWASDAGLTQESYYEQNTSLYNAQPPPSPFSKQKLVTSGSDKVVKRDSSPVSSWSSFFADKLKFLAFFVIAVCIVYFFVLYLESYNQENPIQEN
jgi:hypothetical protein